MFGESTKEGKNVNTFEEFCGGTFWNASLLLDNSWPEFTPCFTNTFLVWIPCGYVWILLPYFLYTLHNKNNQSNWRPTTCNTDRSDCKIDTSDAHHDGVSQHPKFTIVCSTKIVLTGLLAMLYLIQMILKVRDEQPGAASLSSAIYFVTYMLVVFQLWYERHKGHIAMFISFYFYIMNIIFGVIPLYTWIITKDYQSYIDRFLVLVFAIAFNLVCFILSWLNDDPGLTKHKHKRNNLNWKPSPEITASYPSGLCFTWLTSLISIAVRKEITSEDLFGLNPHHQSDTLNPVFEQYWKDEVNRTTNLRPAGLHNLAFSSDTNLSLSNGKDTNVLLTKGKDIAKYQAIDHNKAAQNGYDHKQTKKLNDKTSLLNKRHTVFNTWRQRSKSYDQKTPSLIRVLFRMEWKTIVKFLIQKILSDVFLCSAPLFLGMLVDNLSNSNERTMWQAYFLCLVIMITINMRSLFFSHSKHDSSVFAVHIKTVLASAIFKKALTISNSARRNFTVGEIVNLMSVDCQRIQDVFADASFIMTVPLQILIAIILLYVNIGLPMLASLCVLILTIPFNSWIVKQQKFIQESVLKLKDKRIKLLTETITGIKVLKLYAWENKFMEKVAELRKKEIIQLFKVAYVNALSDLIMGMTPFLCSVTTFAMYTLMDRNNVLDARIAFVSLSLFNLVRVPIISVKVFVSFIVQVSVSLKRINAFLVAEDLDLSNTNFISDSDHAITIRNGTFTWETNSQPTLVNINTNIAVGKLTAIVGSVGSGKSSLISAVLGEMNKLHGYVAIKGTVAYVPQQAWIQNATVRDNILFGREYNKQRYMQVVKACKLERDLEILEAGDQTEIGEKGINLSGGQKQRVNLARAVYSNSDIYLFDDPLSAVDAHVGKAIFKNIVGPNGILSNTTRVLVTHGIHWLPKVDNILVLTNGVISEEGSYDELVSHNGPFTKFLQTYFQNEVNDESTSDEDEDLVQSENKNSSPYIPDAVLSRYDNHTNTDRKDVHSNQLQINGAQEKTVVSNGNKIAGKLTIDELLQSGKVSSDVFLTFGQVFGFCNIFIVVLMLILNRAFIMWANFFLADWTRDEMLLNSTTRNTLEGNERLVYYLAVYGAGFGFAQMLTLGIYTYLLWNRMVNSALSLHKLLLVRLFHAPMSFFDQTPIGQILSRFSKDVDTIDNIIPFCLIDTSATLTLVIITVTNTIIQTPFISPVFIPVAILLYLLQKYYMRTSRQLKRMESIARSPVFSHVSEAFTGAAVIRAYKETDRFVEELEQRVDINQTYFFANHMTFCWLQLVLDNVAGVLIFTASAVLVANGGDSSAVGLSVSYTLQMLVMAYMVRQMSEFQTSVVAVERIKEYSLLEQEAKTVIPDYRPSPSWPEKGHVTFSEYQTRYRKGLDPVLKGITCQIKGGEKIGIIGRTGAGKSSLVLSLFRIIEPINGAIIIDDVNIVDIGLHDLRSKLTILPQDSVIFSGSLRSNLDPFNEYTDDQLWAALERSHLKSFVSAQPEKLNLECEQDGSNLSVGQRQLVCLARSLLRHTKILILDEATAAVDLETDSFVQNTIKEAFSDCTIIAIAHRLSTIIDYDRVIVMDVGVIREFDTPTNLLAAKGMFYTMCRDAGLI